MSSSRSPQPPCSPPASSRLHPLTFWCHECDMSVSLLPSPSLPPCPHCRRLDSLLPLDSISPLPLPLPSFSPSQPSPDLPPTNLSAPLDSISALPTVQIASSSSSVCAICKDDLPLGSFARRLPCSHHFHSDCIVPWLSLRNSCPLCRSKIPCPRRPRTPRFRIRLLDAAAVHAEAAHNLSPTQMLLQDTASIAPTNSVETVTSDWPGWGGGEEDELADVIMSDVWEDLFA